MDVNDQPDLKSNADSRICQVTLIEQALTGAGRAFEGCTVTRTGYVPITQDPNHDNAKGKVLVQYTNEQWNDDFGDDIICPQQAIYKLWFEENNVATHTWPAAGNQLVAGTGNQKRAAACSLNRSGSGTATATGTKTAGTNTASTNTASTNTAGTNTGSTNTAGTNTGGTNTGGTNTGSTNTNTNLNTNTNTATDTGTKSGFTTSVVSSSNTITAGPTTASGASATASTQSHTTYACYPFADPDAGPTTPECQCDGLPGFYPYLSSSTGQKSYNPCGYTTSPTPASATSSPFTTTESDGEVVSCASSTYYNYAVNTIPTCAGATKVISTVASIASVYSASSASAASKASVASVSSASDAAWSSAAAVPSAACWILDDDGFGDSAFEVYGINGWAGDGGSKLWDQENGCGIVSGGEFYTDGQSAFEGRLRDTQYAYFGLSFFKGGCVERAVHSAGGPSPGTGPGEIACQHVPSSLSSDQSNAVSSIAGPQLKAVQAVAEGNTTASTFTEDEVVQPGSSSTGQSNAELKASASAALPHLLAAASIASGAPAASST